MSSGKVDVERVRRHLRDLSSDVARRLIAVLDASREGGYELSHEFNAVVCEIAAIQRELFQELTSEPQTQKSDTLSLARMLERNKQAMTLLEHLETLPAQSGSPPSRLPQSGPAQSDLRHSAVPQPARQLAARPASADYPTYALPVVRPAEPYGGSVAPALSVRGPLPADRQGYVPYDAWDGPARPEFRPQQANFARLAHNAGRVRQLPAVRPSGLIAVALVVVFGLSATVGARIFSGSVSPGLQSKEPTAAPRETAAASASGPVIVTPPPSTVLAEARADAAPMTETGALPQSGDAGGPYSAFVAVLATYDDPDKARDALERLREAYPAILGPIDTQTDAVDGEDGKRWYRLTARPAVAREEADELCRQLSERGHTGCWVKPVPRAGEAGFVAVLATRNEAAAALDQFRQLKGRYPAILGSTEPEVETIETEGGATWHRLSTRPAGSQSEAKDLCRRLREAGYFTCWVKPQG